MYTKATFRLPGQWPPTRTLRCLPLSQLSVLTDPLLQSAEIPSWMKWEATCRALLPPPGDSDSSAFSLSHKPVTCKITKRKTDSLAEKRGPFQSQSAAIHILSGLTLTRATRPERISQTFSRDVPFPRGSSHSSVTENSDSCCKCASAHSQKQFVQPVCPSSVLSEASCHASFCLSPRPLPLACGPTCSMSLGAPKVRVAACAALCPESLTHVGTL